MATAPIAFGAPQRTELTELYSRVFYEKVDERSSRRFALRVVQFANSNVPYVALSKYWLDTITNQWFPTKTGHIFLPADAWAKLVDVTPTVKEEIKNVINANDRGARGMGQNAERVLPAACVPLANYFESVAANGASGSNAEPTDGQAEEEAHASVKGNRRGGATGGFNVKRAYYVN